jgi:hypothetical protein
MAYTEAQWNKFQASLPAEDRISYLDYLKEEDPAAYNKLVSKILENLKTAELQSGTPITKVVDERAKIAGAKTDKAAQKAATVAAAKVVPNFRAAEAASAKTDSAAPVSVSAVESAAQKRAAEAKAEADAKAEEEAARIALAKKIADAKAAQEAADKAAADAKTDEEKALAAALAEAAAAAAADADATASLAGDDSTAADEAADVVTELAEPPGRPGKAWIVAADGKTWVKPGMPSDGKKYDWNDETGWVLAVEAADEYTTVDGVLTFKGSPFTGSYNGKNYKDGKVVEEPAADEYTTVGGVLMFKGAAFTGNYNGKNYKDGKIVEAPGGDQYATVNGLFTLNGKPFTGTYQGKNYKDGKLVEAEVDAEDDTEDGAKTYTATDGTKFTDQAAYVAYQKMLTEGDLANKTKIEEALAARQSAYDLLYTQFANYGLGSLVEPLKGLIKSGASPSEFAIKLRTDPLYNTAYKKRFAANDLRISKGLKAIDEATYLGLEDQYQEILRNAGLPESYWKRGELGIQEGFTNFIANDVSATELEDRVNTAQQRVLYANPEVSIALKTFYPDITNGDLLAYALDPTKGLDQIKRRITAAEIGSSAVQMGLATNVTDAEYLARYGVNKAQAQQGYRTAAEVLPTASKLGDIYANQGLGAYTQQTAEQEIFNVPGAAQAAEKRRKLSELEQASFSGKAGMGALARDRAGAF